MNVLLMLLMTTSVPSADLVAQPPPATYASPIDDGAPEGGRHRLFGRLRALFSHRAPAPQKQPACGCGAVPGGALQPMPVALPAAPITAGPISPPVPTFGPAPSIAPTAVTVSPAPATPPQGMPSAPVTFPVSTTVPSSAMGPPQVTTPAAAPAARPMPTGPANPF
jgi:hypothetical protein